MHQNWFFCTAHQIFNRSLNQIQDHILFPVGRLSASYTVYLQAILRCTSIRFGHVFDEIDPSFNLGSICTHSWQIYRDKQSRVALRISSAAWNTPGMPLLQVGPCGDAVGCCAPTQAATPFWMRMCAVWYSDVITTINWNITKYETNQSEKTLSRGWQTDDFNLADSGQKGFREKVPCVVPRGSTSNGRQDTSGKSGWQSVTNESRAKPERKPIFLVSRCQLINIYWRSPTCLYEMREFP